MQNNGRFSDNSDVRGLTNGSGAPAKYSSVASAWTAKGGGEGDVRVVFECFGGRVVMIVCKRVRPMAARSFLLRQRPLDASRASAVATLRAFVSETDKKALLLSPKNTTVFCFSV